MGISVTEKAIEEVKKVMQDQGFTPQTHALEAGAVGGGCSGYSYSLGFKEKSKIDPLNETVVEQHGVTVAINNKSLTLMEGTVVDFHSDLNRRGFVFANPLASKCCGCGSSFQV